MTVCRLRVRALLAALAHMGCGGSTSPTSPTSPTCSDDLRLIGYVQLPGFAQEVASDGTSAVVAVSPVPASEGQASGLAVVDVSDPTRPSIVSFVENVEPLDVEFRDGVAFTVNWDATLRAYELSESQALVELSSVALSNSATSLALMSQYAVVGIWNGGIDIVDISDPTQLHVVGKAENRLTRAVAVWENYSLVADSKEGLILYDLTDPTNPARVGTGQRGEATALDTLGGYAFVAHRENDLGLLIYSLATPTPPHLVNEPGSKGLNLKTVLARDPWLWTAGNSLVVWNAADPETPSAVNSLVVRGWGGLEVTGRYAYVSFNGLADGEKLGAEGDGLAVVDVGCYAVP